jgi:alkylation response protein AidB-like acyl-CoA dehydrogenase
VSLRDRLITGDQADLVSGIDELCASLIDDAYLARTDREARFPAEVMDALRAQGWAGMVVPAEFGGSDASTEDLTTVLEALARHSLVVAQIFFSLWLLPAAAIAANGNAAQKEKWLTRVATDGDYIAFALTEPGSGSDAAALATSAVKVDGGWRVSGQKVFTTGAAVASTIITAVRTGRGEKKRDGISMLLIDPQTPGVEVRKLSKFGLRGLDLCEVFLDDVFVSDDDVLGEVDRGWSGVVDGLALERVCLAAISTGALTDLLERCLEHGLTRESFGRPIASHQLVADKLVEMRVAVECGRGLYRRAAAMVDQKLPEAGVVSSMAKLTATRDYVSAAREGVQIFGGYGFTDDYPASWHYRDCKYLEIGGGASEIQTIIIARDLGIRL